MPDALERVREHRQANILAWAHDHFYIGPGETIDPLPHQVALLRLFSSRRPDGSAWRNQVYSTVKKSGKTAVAALLTRFDAEHGPGGREMYLAANDRDQATNRVFDAIRRSILYDPSASTSWAMTAHELRHTSGTFIRAIASDFRGEAGSNPSRTVWTELWGFDQESARRFFEELTPVPTIESTRFVETSTGYEGQSDLLRDLYTMGQAGRQLTADELSEWTGTPLGAFSEATRPRDPVPIWINDAASLLMYWDEGLVARRMPWQQGAEGDAYYREQEQTLRPSQFKRLHLNQWTQADEAFIDITWWDRCAEDVPELGPKEPLVLAIDAASKNDSFAIVGVTRHWDPARRDRDIAVRIWSEWRAPRSGRIDFAEPLAEVIELTRRYNVVTTRYDPYDMTMFSQVLYDQVRNGWVQEFSQGQDREVADKMLYDLIQGGHIAHCDPPQIRQHLLNANVKLSQEGRMRIVKRAEGAPVDLAVALSMAAYTCLRFDL